MSLQGKISGGSISTLSADMVSNILVHGFNVDIQGTLLRGSISTFFTDVFNVLMHSLNVYLQSTLV